MEQFEQLLTCCVCLDRYRNPKLLPCQHSFCMEPCMDGLVDYVRRQVKCPECRAEHRIPYQGVQGFPTNVTLQRFLELHIEITGELPDPTSGQTMERCNVCSEKAYCTICGHCDKKICAECKGAHMDILRREISRINNQIRRGIHRLQDALALVEKNTLSLQTNSLSVSEEVDEIYRRLTKALKDRTDFLRGEVDRYLGTELRNLGTLKDNLDLEITNIQSNCDLADKYMTENVEWDDCELMDTKEIFLKTVDFIRNFEYEAGDYSRRVRFAMAMDPNQLVMHVGTYGELNIAQPPAAHSQSSSHLQPPGGGPGLMRSKSDHRLAQFRNQEAERGGYDAEQDAPLSGRKFGERHSTTANRGGSDRYGGGGDRYGRGNEYDYDYENDTNRPSTRSRFRSRFARHADNDSDNEQSSRSVRFTEQQQTVKERERVLDTEDAARGPLSGICRLTDSPRVMKRLQETERDKKKDKEPVAPVQPQVKPNIQITKRPTQPPAPAPAGRQVSEEDEISRIKRQNKGAATSTDTSEQRPVSDRVAALKSRADDEDNRQSSTPASPTRKTPVTEAASSDAEESDESVSSLQQTQRKTAASKSTSASRRSSAGSDVTSSTPSSVVHKKAARSASSDSSTSTESSASSTAVRNTGAAYTTEEVKQKYLTRGSIDETPRSRVSSTSSTPPAPEKKPFQSRFLGGGGNRATPAPVEKPKVEETEEETETSSEEETETSEESEEETKKPATTNADMSKTDIGPLLARSSQARETAETRRNSKDESPYSRHQYNSTSSPSAYKSPYSTPQEETPKYTRTRPTPQPAEEESPSRYGTSGYTSRFLNKSKSTAHVAPEEEEKAQVDDESRYPSGRSRYMALKDRRNRLARSRSSHNFGGEDDDVDEPMSPTTTSPNAYLASRYASGIGSSATANDLSRSRSSHALKSRENSPDRPSSTSGTGDKDGAALSSWARYLKNKYGNRGSKDTKDSTPSSSTLTPSSSSSASRRLSLGLPLRAANEHGSSDDDSKNVSGSPTSPTAATAAVGIAAGIVGISPRSQYLQKRRQLFQVGSRGSEPGSFTWPRGIAVGPDNSIVVADSSNHRVQVFNSEGIFLKEFGGYGNGEGEFDCLAGVAVNRIGQYIIADRYNHRIQVLDPSGRFLRAFGSQGTADGRFNYPWGITTDALGFIYVCDKENHRVQVFQSDGTFVGKFGSCGNKPGQLEHPHYIAVSNTNRVIVSDSNNHRVQIFDVNGRVLTAFGSEGSDEGQFKFPRGVAVDDQGYICVADSGNNRIQIFHPDGSFLRAFGCWGSGDAEFKGLEGIAVMSNGNILVCDRENHRVQVF